MSTPPTPALAAWLTLWRFWMRYHRYSVRGLEENLDPLEGAALIVGYHGRPLAGDMCMLTVKLYDRYGYLPHGIVHRGLHAAPPIYRLARDIGFVTDVGPEIEAAVGRGEHIVTTPGGADEAGRDHTERYRVEWGRKLGYLRLAQRHGLPIVPVGAAGCDDTYIGLNDTRETGERLGVPRQWSWALWLGLGPIGPYPFSPPFPVKITQLVGRKIDPPAPDDDEEALLERHQLVTSRVQALLDRARAMRRRPAPRLPAGTP